MNHELAKTLTTALVQFIDRERPGSTMCCSNIECGSLEEAFKSDNLDDVEAFVQKKLSRLTEFETHLKWLIENGGSGIEHVKVGAKELLDLAKKELLKDDELGKKHLEGYIMGREDTMREMKDFIESHFNTNKAKEGGVLTDLYYKEYVGNPQPIPSGWGCDGTHCTNPHGDCINCPKRFSSGETITTPNTASGISTATLHGNTSVTNGKPHNPSFTD